MHALDSMADQKWPGLVFVDCRWKQRLFMAHRPRLTNPAPKNTISHIVTSQEECHQNYYPSRWNPRAISVKRLIKWITKRDAAQRCNINKNEPISGPCGKPKSLPPHAESRKWFHKLTVRNAFSVVIVKYEL